jgi:chromosome segregation ATPase
MEEQARGLFDIEMLARAERHAESLRGQLIEVQTKEMEAQARLDELEYRLRPESINMSLAFVGSPRIPEMRDDLRNKLELEKSRLTSQLEMLVTSREKLERAVRDADESVDRLREMLTTLRAATP